MPAEPMSKQKAAANLGELVSECSRIANNYPKIVGKCGGLMKILTPAQRGVFPANTDDLRDKLVALNTAMLELPDTQKFVEFQIRLNAAIKTAHAVGLLVADRSAGMAR